MPKTQDQATDGVSNNVVDTSASSIQTSDEKPEKLSFKSRTKLIEKGIGQKENIPVIPRVGKYFLNPHIVYQH